MDYFIFFAKTNLSLCYVHHIFGIEQNKALVLDLKHHIDQSTGDFYICAMDELSAIQTLKSIDMHVFPRRRAQFPRID